MFLLSLFWEMSSYVPRSKHPFKLNLLVSFSTSHLFTRIILNEEFGDLYCAKKAAYQIMKIESVWNPKWYKANSVPD